MEEGMKAEVIKQAETVKRWCPISFFDGDDCEYRGEPHRCSLDPKTKCVMERTENDKQLCSDLDAVYGDDPNHWADDYLHRNDDTWNALKQEGASHYRSTGSIQPIDLLRSLAPHHSLSAFAVKALGDTIKYATRQITEGYNQSDTDKMVHYLRLLKAEHGG